MLSTNKILKYLRIYKEKTVDEVAACMTRTPGFLEYMEDANTPPNDQFIEEYLNAIGFGTAFGMALIVHCKVDLRHTIHDETLLSIMNQIKDIILK